MKITSWTVGWTLKLFKRPPHYLHTNNITLSLKLRIMPVTHQSIAEKWWYDDATALCHSLIYCHQWFFYSCLITMYTQCLNCLWLLNNCIVYTSTLTPWFIWLQLNDFVMSIGLSLYIIHWSSDYGFSYSNFYY